MNTPQPEVSIIIVNYNVKELLTKCIASVYKFCKTSFEIILIDNNSIDESVVSIKSNFPNVIVIENKYNAGFPKANNQGIDIAKGNYILLLNPDTELQNDSISELLQFLKSNEEVSLLAPKLLNTDLSIQFSIQQFVTVKEIIAETFYLHHFYKNRKSYYNKPINEPIQVEAVSGAAILMQKSVIEKIGALDEDLFWTEDMEFCYRAFKNGLKTIYYPHTAIIHHGSVSGKKNPGIMISNQTLSKITFFRKNHSKTAYFTVKYFRLVHILSRILVFKLLTLYNAQKFVEKEMAYRYTFTQFKKRNY